jgi:hypothetical protein
VPLPRVVEGGSALDVEGHPAPYDPDVTDEPVTLTPLSEDGHEIHDLGHSLRGEEPGEQHVGVRQIQLVTVGVLHRAQIEASAPLVVEDGAENARRVEGRQTQPVYRPVSPDERRCVKIPHDPMVLYGKVTQKSLIPSFHGSAAGPTTYLTLLTGAVGCSHRQLSSLSFPKNLVGIR